MIQSGPPHLYVGGRFSICWFVFNYFICTNLLSILISWSKTPKTPAWSCTSSVYVMLAHFIFRLFEILMYIYSTRKRSASSMVSPNTDEEGFEWGFLVCLLFCSSEKWFHSAVWCLALQSRSAFKRICSLSLRVLWRNLRLSSQCE